MRADAAGPHDTVVVAFAAPTVWATSKTRTAQFVLTGIGLAFVAGALGALNLKYGLAFVLAAVLVGAVLARPIVGGLVLVGVVPAVSGLAPGVPVHSVRLSEALIGLVAATLLIGARREDRPTWGALEWLLLVYGSAWAIFGIVDAKSLGQHLTLAEWGTVLGQLQFFLLYRGVRIAVRTPSERRRAVATALGCAVPVALLAIAQEARLPGVEPFILRITDGTAPTGGLLRATGPFDNWAALAGYLLPLVLVVVALTLAGLGGERRRRMLQIGALLLLAFLLTAELSAILCLVAGVIYLGVRYACTRRVLSALGGAAVVGGAILGPFLGARVTSELTKTAGVARGTGVPQTIAYRMNIWTGQYLPAISRRPVSGFGVVLPNIVSWPYPESQYIALLIEGGFPMLLLFGLVTIGMLSCLSRASRAADPFDAALGRALLVVSLSLVAMDAIWPYVSNGGLSQMLWALLGVAAPGWVATTTKALPPIRREATRTKVALP